MSTKLFSGTITSRYGELEKNIYQQVMELVKKNSISKSRAQLLLVERGLQHTQNPEPLIKNRGVDKKTGQRSSSGMLTTQDKAESTPSNTALEEKKPAGAGWVILGFLAVGGVVWLIRKFTFT